MTAPGRTFGRLVGGVRPGVGAANRGWSDVGEQDCRALHAVGHEAHAGAGQQRRRFYRLTPAGRRELAVRRHSWQEFVAAVDGVVLKPA